MFLKTVSQKKSDFMIFVIFYEFSKPYLTLKIVYNSKQKRQ